MNAARSALVAARGEDLLELVDRQHDAVGVGVSRPDAVQLAHRMLAGPNQHLRPLVAARQDPAGQGGQQSGPHDRGLAAARRSDDAEQRRADRPRDELGDEPLASEEVPGVGDVEAGEALERAHQRRLVRGEQIGALAGRLEVDHAPRPAPPRPRRSSARPADARGADAPTRRAAWRRAHALASSCTRPGTPPLVSSSSSTWMSATVRPVHSRPRCRARRRRRAAQARARRRHREPEPS